MSDLAEKKKPAARHEGESGAASHAPARAESVATRRAFMKALTLARLPISGCAGFIAFLFLANLWNFAVEGDWPKLRIRSAWPLYGVAKPKPAPWTFDAFLSGETQKAVSINLGRMSPVFPISVRAKNQLVFSLFGGSAAPGVVIGRNGQLYEQFYIDEFCARDGAFDSARLGAWSLTLHEIQESAQARGKSFVYLISPSKAARYPEDLPKSAACALRATAMPEKLAPYRAALDEAHVSYVDGPALIAAEKPKQPIPLFPRGGTHWNSVGGALAMREATRALPASPVGVLAFASAPAPEALGTDRDLLDLLNLLSPDAHYPTAAVGRAGEKGDCARPPRLLALGGSFLHEVLAAATLAPCPPQIDYWFYMRTEDNSVELGHYRRAPGDASNGERLPATTEELDENLAGADFILLEENESSIATTKQVGHLAEALRRLP
ncbi:alginate O-acetyltransferase [Methylocystis sp. L43]|uniref:alginate O-acetyltransferase AlgX-related protein n=1 Tax=unclassified Methylocystis TaxID=2625913 RepID=UPI0018C23F0A|nr:MULTISPECIES: alginate O-acetyltransferase [unclassified Methylocystis]MBG0797956.1 alginate O-acetyltransferase [Methylocystis sp. L43]MBG0805430.1 alginate O-acetyltransferase [Methylocystis sp. H15]